MLETHFLALEVASTVEIHPVEEPKKLETLMASWKGAKVTVEAGQTEGYGKILELSEKRDRFGMRY